MKAKKTHLLGWLLVLMMLVQMFAASPGILSGIQAQAANAFPFITDVTVTDVNGNQLTTVTPTTEVVVKYTYFVDNLTDADSNPYTFSLPNEVASPSEPITRDLMDGGTKFATYTVGTDKTVTVNFTAEAGAMSDVHGTFDFVIFFEEHAIGGE